MTPTDSAGNKCIFLLKPDLQENSAMMYTLLAKVGCMVIGNFQIDQHHLMLKVSLKSSTQDHVLSQKEGVSGTKHFYWVPFYGIRSFHASFHNVSMYMKFPQKLVMIHQHVKLN